MTHLPRRAWLIFFRPSLVFFGREVFAPSGWFGFWFLLYSFFLLDLFPIEEEISPTMQSFFRVFDSPPPRPHSFFHLRRQIFYWSDLSCPLCFLNRQKKYKVKKKIWIRFLVFRFVCCYDWNISISSFQFFLLPWRRVNVFRFLVFRFFVCHFAIHIPFVNENVS